MRSKLTWIPVLTFLIYLSGCLTPSGGGGLPLDFSFYPRSTRITPATVEWPAGEKGTCRQLSFTVGSQDTIPQMWGDISLKFKSNVDFSYRKNNFLCYLNGNWFPCGIGKDSQACTLEEIEAGLCGGEPFIQHLGWNMHKDYAACGTNTLTLCYLGGAPEDQPVRLTDIQLSYVVGSGGTYPSGQCQSPEAPRVEDIRKPLPPDPRDFPTDMPVKAVEVCDAPDRPWGMLSILPECEDNLVTPEGHIFPKQGFHPCETTQDCLDYLQFLGTRFDQVVCSQGSCYVNWCVPGLEGPPEQEDPPVLGAVDGCIMACDRPTSWCEGDVLVQCANFDVSDVCSEKRWMRTSMGCFQGRVVVPCSREVTTSTTSIPSSLTPTTLPPSGGGGGGSVLDFIRGLWNSLLGWLWRWS